VSATPVNAIDEPAERAREDAMIKSAESVEGAKGSSVAVSTESVPDILDRELQAMIKD
jgi:hypothetical protein